MGSLAGEAIVEEDQTLSKLPDAMFPMMSGELPLSNTLPDGETPLPSSPSNRIEANTAFLKISEAAGVDGTVTPIPNDDGEDEGGEAASARIAQEYRRQVRIKRLAEEIQVAEREKKEEEKRRKLEVEEVEAGAARLTTRKEAVVPQDAAAKRPSALLKATDSKPKALSVFIKKPMPKRQRFALTVTVAALLLAIIGCGTIVGFYMLKSYYTKQVLASNRPVPAIAPGAIIVDELKKKEAEEAKQKLAAEAQIKQAEESARNAALTLELQRKLDAEQAARAVLAKKAQEAEALRAAEELRFKESNERALAEQRKANEKLRAEIDEASRLAREKMKREQDEATKVAEAAIPPAKPEPAAPKTVPATTARPEFVANDGGQPVAEQKVIVPPAPTIPGLPDIPNGGVRLFVKASDPYNGKLTFQWSQLKGKTVEIADPSSAIFQDGKWYSQTYFFAREPGTYEFDITVRNEDGVETHKQFPIEVLPPATLK